MEHFSKVVIAGVPALIFPKRSLRSYSHKFIGMSLLEIRSTGDFSEEAEFLERFVGLHYFGSALFIDSCVPELSASNAYCNDCYKFTAAEVKDITAALVYPVDSSAAAIMQELISWSAEYFENKRMQDNLDTLLWQGDSDMLVEGSPHFDLLCPVCHSTNVTDNMTLERVHGTFDDRKLNKLQIGLFRIIECKDCKHKVKKILKWNIPIWDNLVKAKPRTNWWRVIERASYISFAINTVSWIRSMAYNNGRVVLACALTMLLSIILAFTMGSIRKAKEKADATN